MKTKFLFKIIQNENNLEAISSWDESNIPNCRIHEKTEDELLKTIDKEVENLINTSCTIYIVKNSQSETHINCPKLKIILPIDSFYCKVDNNICMLGRDVEKTNKNYFIKNCRITAQKEGIWNAIETQKYKGFHHLIGRYLCPYCEHKNENKNEIKFNYHYPWEFFKLYQEIKIDRDMKIKMIKNKIPSFIFYSALCADCSIDINNKLHLNIVLQNIEKEIFRK